MGSKTITERVTKVLAGETPEDLEQVRANRRSAWYPRWKRFLTFLEGNPSNAQILREIHGFVDGIRGYRTRTNAGGAFEALEQFIKDKKLK